MDDNVKLPDEFTPLRDRIAEVVYVRDRFDGPPTTTADAILAMPEMQLVRDLLSLLARTDNVRDLVLGNLATQPAVLAWVAK